MSNENEQLNVQDLQSILRIIELASQRGAFRAAEFSKIGVIVDKIIGFVNLANQQIQKTTQTGDI